LLSAVGILVSEGPGHRMLVLRAVSSIPTITLGGLGWMISKGHFQPKAFSDSMIFPSGIYRSNFCL